MKKKAVIIIIACVVVLAGIVLAYFTLPISYAGTSEKYDGPSVDEHKLILPTEAQASLIKKGMPMKEVFDTIGLPQKDYGSGIYLSFICVMVTVYGFIRPDSMRARYNIPIILIRLLKII